MGGSYLAKENCLWKISPQGGAKKRRHCLSPIWPMECSENAFQAITPTPKLPQSKTLYAQIHWSQLHLSALATPICVYTFFSRKPLNCLFPTLPTFFDQSTPNFAHDIFRHTRKECTKDFFDPTFDDETVAF